MTFALQRRTLATATILVLTILFASGSTDGGEAWEGPSHGPLDGMAFVGRIGPADNPDVDDTLYFKNGHFWSQACTRCGFAPAPYWARYVGDGIEFRGILESPDRGRFSYLGFVDDGRATVTINWRRDRWYWSINRDMRFEGVLANAAGSDMTLEAARLAAKAEPENPDSCP